MTKQDLREAFAKINPRGELVEDTIRKVSEQRNRAAQKEPFFSRVLRYRMVAATCALALVLVTGIIAGRERFGTENTPNAGSAVESRQVARTPSIHMYTLEEETEQLKRFINTAEAAGGNWVVICGTVDGCYFDDRSEKDGYCVTQIEASALCAHNISGITEEDLVEGGVIAEFDGNDEEKLNELLATFSGTAYLRLVQKDNYEFIRWELVDFELKKDE